MKDFFLADDLSGALDAAAAFHLARRRVTVALSTALAGEPDADVVGLTTETRNVTPSAAAAIVERTLAEARRQGARLLYKKIDSTLRGPVAAEVAALARAMPEVRILFAPANPAAGRTVRGGILLVRGVPVGETEFARDPSSPVTTSDLRTLLGNMAPGRIVIPDAETEADLTAAVEAMDATGEPWVAVGSGALARPVARRVAGSTPLSAIGFGSEFHEPTRSVLLVCGSAHPLNRTQAARLARDHNVTLHVMSGDGTAINASMEKALRAQKTAILMMEERRGDSALLVQALTKAAADLIGVTGCSRLFVTGGETAFALCSRLGIDGLQFQAEIEPGLSLSFARDRNGPVWLAVKPGGFGDGQTWVRAWDALQSRNE